MTGLKSGQVRFIHIITLFRECTSESLLYMCLVVVVVVLAVVVLTYLQYRKGHCAASSVLLL